MIEFLKQLNGSGWALLVWLLLTGGTLIAGFFDENLMPIALTSVFIGAIPALLTVRHLTLIGKDGYGR